jgi:hypothetical protein
LATIARSFGEGDSFIFLFAGVILQNVGILTSYWRTVLRLIVDCTLLAIVLDLFIIF